MKTVILIIMGLLVVTGVIVERCQSKRSKDQERQDDFVRRLQRDDD